MQLTHLFSCSFLRFCIFGMWLLLVYIIHPREGGAPPTHTPSCLCGTVASVDDDENVNLGKDGDDADGVDHLQHIFMFAIMIKIILFIMIVFIIVIVTFVITIRAL